MTEVMDVCSVRGCRHSFIRDDVNFCGTADPTRSDTAGCSGFYCPEHVSDHDCSRPACGRQDSEEQALCGLAVHHTGLCWDEWREEEFIPAYLEHVL